MPYLSGYSVWSCCIGMWTCFLQHLCVHRGINTNNWRAESGQSTCQVPNMQTDGSLCRFCSFDWVGLAGEEKVQRLLEGKIAYRTGRESKTSKGALGSTITIYIRLLREWFMSLFFICRNCKSKYPFLVMYCCWIFERSFIRILSLWILFIKGKGK